MSKLIVAQSFPCTLDSTTTPFGIACGLFSGRLVRDRFNVLNQYSKLNWIDTVDPIPEIETRPLSKLMDQRAQELIAKGSITVQWSGGVDSTSLLLALIKNGIKKDNLVIYGDSYTVEEYPKLFCWLRDQGYNLHTVWQWRKELSNAQTDIITNGWCADQLFGSVFFHNFPEKYFTPVEELIKDFDFLGSNATEGEAVFASEVFKKYAKDVFNLELSTAAQLGWFINFTLKWTWVSTFNELYLANTPNKFKTYVFYNTPYFQGWSLGNYSKISNFNIYGKDASQYKRELKEYCNSVFPDPDYLANKTKKPSWNATQSSVMYEKMRIVVKTDNKIEILNVPQQFINFSELYRSNFFTKFYK